MIDIVLYQADGINETVAFPSEWNELSVSELEAVANIMLKQLSIEESNAGIFIQLLQLRSNESLPKNFVKNIDPEDAAINGLPLVHFIYQENNLTKQPYEHLIVSGQKMKGPESNFDSITCGEFEECEIFFRQFQQANVPDMAHLASIAAILYRPQKKNFITYQHTTDEYITYNYLELVPFFLKLPEAILFTIYMWYTGCHHLLTKLFHLCHTGGESNQPDLMAFTKCIHAAAGDKNGTRNQVRRLPLKELFFDMEIELQKQKDLEKHYAT